jgi:hypothetical protein
VEKKLYALILPVNEHELQVETEYYQHELGDALKEMGITLSARTSKLLASGEQGTVIFDTDDNKGDFVIVIM